jgi:hypothetical protein
MQVLTATKRTQGWRGNDFFCAVEGELVLFPPIECGFGSIDDGCGCRRSMAGLVIHRATTTMMVVDREELDPDTYFILISDGLKSMGYVTDRLARDPEVHEWLHHLSDELMSLAAGFTVGTVVERRGELVSERPAFGQEAGRTR